MHCIKWVHSIPTHRVLTLLKDAFYYMYFKLSAAHGAQHIVLLPRLRPCTTSITYRLASTPQKDLLEAFHPE